MISLFTTAIYQIFSMINILAPRGLTCEYAQTVPKLTLNTRNNGGQYMRSFYYSFSKLLGPDLVHVFLYY